MANQRGKAFGRRTTRSGQPPPDVEPEPPLDARPPDPAPEPPLEAPPPPDLGLTPALDGVDLDDEDAEDLGAEGEAPEGPAVTSAVVGSLISSSRSRSSVEADPAYVALRASMLEEALTVIETTDLSVLTPDEARREIREAVSELIHEQGLLLNANEERKLIDDICDRMVGRGL
jgi:pilus assembly protein CpaF